MSFNSKKQGRPLAYIINTKNSKLGTIYLNDKDLSGDTEIKNSDEFKVGLLPNCNERDVLYIAGASGSGKTTMANAFIEEYLEMFPDRSVHIYSSVANYDRSLKSADNPSVEIHDINELVGEEQEVEDAKGKIKTILASPWDEPAYILEQLNNSLVLFDDVFNLDKSILDRILFILRTLLETGRHSNTSVIITSHILLDGNRTKMFINEATAVVFFPRSNKSQAMGYLRRYAGMDEQSAREIVNLKSRWVIYMKCYPNCIIYENGTFLI